MSEPLCPACHHKAHDPGSCSECPRCELHTDEALEFVLRYEPELVTAIEAAAAEAERARIWAALSKPHQAWCSALLGACDCGHDAAAVLAAIDAPGTGETLHERQVRLNYERPGRATIDDEAKG